MSLAVSSASLNGVVLEKRDPSVTPQKFRKFFTPQNIGNLHINSAGKSFNDIIQSDLTHKEVKSSSMCSFRGRYSRDSSPLESLMPESKKRKRHHAPESSSNYLTSKNHSSVGICKIDTQNGLLPSSPCERAARFFVSGFTDKNNYQQSHLSKRILSLRSRGLAGELLERSFGRGQKNRKHCQAYLVNDFQNHTASFYSKPDDVHLCTSLEEHERTIPFCAAACNTNSLVAVGDEDGHIRLLEAGEVKGAKFKDLFLSFHIHKNAIIDMEFSNDDARIVTASGDQSSRVVDMSSQTTVSILSAHTASLKQARFQPGSSNNNIVATSSRDGSIQVWDLRCRGYEKPLIQIHTAAQSERPEETGKIHYSAIINSIYDAHKAFSHQIPANGTSDSPMRGEPAGRLGDVSVTAIQFLSPELNHLLLSSSEADSSVKLWDIRNLQTSRRRRNQVPLSSTVQPHNHSKWRHFGVTSMNLSSDGARIYTLCKDNTVYVYSTAHLMLGQAPDLTITGKVHRRPNQSTKEGLGPLYGFRHPQFHASSFYVKSAIRKPVDGKCEMLAVGSSSSCAVLFPTDERFISLDHPYESFDKHVQFKSPTTDGDVLIYTHGTPLIRGHVREVGSLTWTCNGALVTVGDDFLVRVWKEGNEAKDLRTGGEQGGRRWECGWADVDEEYDKDDS